MSHITQIADVREISEQADGSLLWEMLEHDSGWLQMDGGIVSSIRLSLSSKARLRLEELSQVYGLPSQVTVQRCRDEFCEVGLIFPSHGMIVGLLLRGMGTEALQVSVSPDASVSSIHFVESITEWAARSLPEVAGPVEWRGFGTYP
jgi:hypothetical protein